MTSSRLITIAIILGFIAFLAWGTLSSQPVTCDVCVRYNGLENCATASGVSEEEATTTAQTTACGPLTGGMNDAIACGNLVPVTRQCRTR